MRRYSNRTSLSTLSEINVTPLLDLAFVLLIIFMITTPLMENSKIAHHSLQQRRRTRRSIPLPSRFSRSIAMKSLGSMRRWSSRRSLETRLAELKQADPNVAVVIRPDRNLPVQKLVSLMDALQRAGITKVGIATQEEQK